MRLADFDYRLPLDRIAQTPAAQRESARMYVLPRGSDPASHARVSDLPSLLAEGTLLVVNDTRVIPARLRAKKATGGRVELLLVAPIERSASATAWSERWTCLGGASKAIRPGMHLQLDGIDAPRAEVVEVRGTEVDVRFAGVGPGGMAAVAERLGEIPLPPYIERASGAAPEDRERYQTTYARVPGAVAAPTAGLHFTPSLLDRLHRRGVDTTAITLHVGLGTFAPLRSDDLDAIHDLHAERYEVSEASARRIEEARVAGRPIVAVGTTTVRALESACDAAGAIAPGAGETRLFIRHPFRFRVVTGLLTNFHLPRSSLLVLVSAFAGRERVLAAYADAVERDYRFYSYGDAMLIR